MSTASTLLDNDQPGNAFSEAQLNDRLQQAKLIPLLDSAYATLSAIEKSKHRFVQVQAPMDGEFSKFSRTALTLNLGVCNMPEKSELDWLFYERLPETLRALKKMKRHEYDMFAYAAIQDLNTHLQSLINGKPLMVTQADPTVAAPVKPADLFPDCASTNPDVTAALAKLKKTWQEANSGELSTEDRYTVTAIAQNYLPEAWQMVQKLNDRGEKVQTEADKMFLEQVNLLQQQVDEIVDRGTQDALSSIQAYTLFLKNKTAVPQSALNLGS